MRTIETETNGDRGKEKFEDELLTPKELRPILKVSKQWAYQQIHAGTLPFPYIKVGHYVRFPLSGVRRYIQTQTRTAGSAT